MTPSPHLSLPFVATCLVGLWAAGCVADARSESGSSAGLDGDRALAHLVERLDTCDNGADSSNAAPGAPCTHLVYIRSPSMPLSRMGIPEIEKAASAMGLEVIVLPASALIDASERPATEALRTTLVDAGATVHYPSLVVLTGRDALGPAIAGYKRAEAYEVLLRARRRRSPTETGRTASRPRPDTSRPGASHLAPAMEVLWTFSVEPPPGAFFRRVPGTMLISYDQRGAVYLRDLSTDEAFRGPGWIDFVPSPDGRIFVSPGRGNSGLDFYLAREVLDRGRAGEGAAVEPFFTDPEMADQYPSVGILATDDEGRPVRYRILVSWFAGLAFRDYAVAWNDEGTATVSPATPKKTGCTGLDLSIPILSKDGRELAARDDDAGTTKLFRLDDDGRCREVLDLGRPTSKVGFSDDGRLVAYSSPERSSAFRGTRSHTWVLDRDEGRTVQILASESAGLVIPELVGADSLLIAVREEARSRSAEFRLICCVR